MAARQSPLNRGEERFIEGMTDSQNSNSNTNSGFFNTKTYNNFDQIKENFRRIKSICNVLYSIQVIYSVLWIFVSVYLVISPFHCMVSGLIMVVQALLSAFCLRFYVEK